MLSRVPNTRSWSGEAALLHLAHPVSWGPVLQATGRQGPTGPRRVLFLWAEPGSFSLSSKGKWGEDPTAIKFLTHGHLCMLGAAFVVFNPLPRDDTGRLLISVCMVELFISVLTFIASSSPMERQTPSGVLAWPIGPVQSDSPSQL